MKHLAAKPLNMKRQHPLRLFYLASKNFWLLLIPLVRGLIALRWDVYSWLSGAWFDILIILFIGGFAYFRWRFSYYSFSGSAIHICTGLLVKREYTVPFTSVCAVSAERIFIFRPLKAVNLYLDTNSGALRQADVRITVYRADCDALFKLMRKDSRQGLRTSYRTSLGSLALFSFLFSSTLSGVIFIVTLLMESSRIIGNSLQNTLMVAVTDVTRKLALNLPPLAVAVSLILIAGWLFSFFSSLLRHIGFRIRRSGKIIDIQNGFFTRRRYYIQTDKINYADLRQNLLTKFFSVMSLHVDCSGYGKAKNEIPIFIPITTKEQVYSSLRLLLPNMSVSSGGIRTRWNYFLRFVFLPLAGVAAIPFAARWLDGVFPLWHSMIVFASIMSEIPLIWLLAVKTTDFFTTGLSFCEKNICAKYSMGYDFHTVIIPKNKIAKILVVQNLFQLLSKSCDVYIYTTNEFAKSHRLLSLPADEVYKFLQMTGQTFENTEVIRKFHHKKKEA